MLALMYTREATPRAILAVGAVRYSTPPGRPELY